MLFFSTFSSGNHFVQRSGTILAILIDGHSRTILVKIYRNRAIGLQKMSWKCIFSIFSSGSHFYSAERTNLSNFVRGPRNISVKLFEIGHLSYEDMLFKCFSCCFFFSSFFSSIFCSADPNVENFL